MVKSIYFPLFLSLSLLLFTNCENGPKPVTEDEAYALFNEVILDDTLMISDVCESFKDVNLDSSIKPFFTKKEFLFLKNQQKNRSKKGEPNKIVYFHKGYKKGDFVQLKSNTDDCLKISFPLITSDRKTLLIHIETTFGFLSGSSGDYMYIKKNGRWRLENIFHNIVA